MIVSPAETELIAEHVRHLLATMSFSSAKIRCQSLPPHLYISIEAGPEGKLLIGAHGAHLAALQHIIRGIIRDALPPDTRVVVDVNGYRARREQDLLVMAESAVARAMQQGQAVTLAPMNPADRRVIHTALANRTDIRTESLGEEPNRAVVIRPVSL